jgi:FdhD protein
MDGPGTVPPATTARRSARSGNRVAAGRNGGGDAEPGGGRPTERHRILRRRQGRVEPTSDVLAVEEPLEIRVNGRPLAVTMRTPAPGEDVELALGFLHGEGIAGIGSVTRARECRAPEGDGGLVEVELSEELDPAGGWQREFYATSSCGICGKASIDAVRVAATDPLPGGPRVTAEMLGRLPDLLRGGQRVFERTGGLHAAGIFSAEGELLVLREDVGRHNAVDKVIGRALMRELVPLHDHVLLISGRASFEVAQKALLAGVPILAAVSAPSSLAVRLAGESNMTLVGFLRPGGLNVYTGSERVEMG